MCCCSFFSHIPGEITSEFEINAIDASKNLTDFTTRETWCSLPIRNEVRKISMFPQNKTESKQHPFHNLVFPAAAVVECPPLNFNFINSTNLNSKKIGSAQSAFSRVKTNCKKCGIEINNEQLSGHMKMHSGEKPYKCTHVGCYKSFARNEELTRHKKIHSGIKSYICHICRKGFGRKDHLTKHQKTHLKASEKKMHKCYIIGCNHEYTRSDALARHLSTAHNVKSSLTRKFENGKTPFTIENAFILSYPVT